MLPSGNYWARKNIRMSTIKFPQRLKELRQEKNLTRAQLAADIKVHPASINDWEVDRHRPSFEVLVELAKYFRVTTDYLLGLED